MDGSWNVGHDEDMPEFEAAQMVFDSGSSVIFATADTHGLIKRTARRFLRMEEDHHDSFFGGAGLDVRTVDCNFLYAKIRDVNNPPLFSVSMDERMDDGTAVQRIYRLHLEDVIYPVSDPDATSGSGTELEEFCNLPDVFCCENNSVWRWPIFVMFLTQDVLTVFILFNVAGNSRYPGAFAEGVGAPVQSNNCLFGINKMPDMHNAPGNFVILGDTIHRKFQIVYNYPHEGKRSQVCFNGRPRGACWI